MILIEHGDEGNYIPYFYWAMELYILDQLLKGDEVYFSMWPITGVIVGKNQVLENEINIEYVKSQNIPIYRRFSGGGAVFADEKNIMFTIAKKHDKNFSFEKELSQIVDVLNKFGIPAKFSGRNDITIDGKKISGNSFIQTEKGMIIHGTLLFDSDLEKMVRCITPSSEKLVSNGVASISSRVTNVKKYANGATLAELRKFMEEQLTNKKIVLSDEQKKLLHKQGQRFATIDWIYKQQPAHTKVVKRRMDGGTYQVNLNIRYGRLVSLQIFGDFFEKKSIHEFEKVFTDIEWSKKSLEQLFKTNDIADFVINANNEQFKNLIIEQIIGE